MTHTSVFLMEIKKSPSLKISLKFSRPEKAGLTEMPYSQKEVYTGDTIATMIIDINQDVWKQAYSENTDESWLICIFNKDMQVLSHEASRLAVPYESVIRAAGSESSLFKEITIDQARYYMHLRRWKAAVSRRQWLCRSTIC